MRTLSDVDLEDLDFSQILRVLDSAKASGGVIVSPGVMHIETIHGAEGLDERGI